MGNYFSIWSLIHQTNIKIIYFLDQFLELISLFDFWLTWFFFSSSDHMSRKIYLNLYFFIVLFLFSFIFMFVGCSISSFGNYRFAFLKFFFGFGSGLLQLFHEFLLKWTCFEIFCLSCCNLRFEGLLSKV